MAFLDDIKSKHLSTFVLVTISSTTAEETLGTGYCDWGGVTGLPTTGIDQEFCENNGGTWVQVATPSEPIINVLHRISTQKITFNGHYYKPILLNVPSISESLDIEQRKYKISSVSLIISDYEEDGEHFSDTLNTLINKEVNIYYSSPSCSDLNDCYKAGTYIVRSFSQDEDRITLNCEDLSQDKLHKDLPLNTLTGNSVDDKYQNKPIPMVFGRVDRSPCVIDNLQEDVEGGGYKIIADIFSNLAFSNENIVNGILSPLYIFNEIYANIPSEKFLNLSNIDFDYTIEGVNSDNQYDIVGNEILFLNDASDNLNSIGLPNFDKVQICYIPELKSKKINLGKNNSIEINNIENVITQGDFATSFGNISFTEVDISPAFIKEFPFLISYTVNSKFDSTSLISILPKIAFILESNESNSQKLLFKYGFVNPSEQTTEFGNLTMFNGIENMIEFSEDVLGQGIDLISINNMIGGSTTPVELSRYLELDLIPNMSVKLGYDDIIPIFGSNTEINFNLDIYRAVPVLVHDINKLKSQSFYANVIGRKGFAPTSQDIYSEILSELDFDEELIQEQLNDIDFGQYAFTVDKKINSKKLIEELSQSTPLYPYFKNGEFRIKSIKTNYDGTHNIIKAEDVIKYKYDRTKIEKVYSRVNVKYHYDYGLKDFTKETGFISANQLISIDGYLIGNNEDYFGQDFDQEFVFESKYIRDEPTALNLAKYLVGLHANQHNIINLTLPLNYLILELGDIVKFDSLIQGRKIFGEDYIINQDRNGQNIYPYFFVEQIKKSLDKVEVKLYQLHNFSFNDSIIYGCTNPQADNYDPSATTDDGSCIMPELEQGCTNPDALNYNPNAQEDNGTCVNQLQLLPPEIITPTDGQVFPIEFTAEELGNNLIPSPTDNSTFDTTLSQLIAFVEGTTTYGSGLGYFDVEYDGLIIATAEDWIGMQAINLITYVTGNIIHAEGSIVDGWTLRAENITWQTGQAFMINRNQQLGSSWYPTGRNSNLMALNDYSLHYLAVNSSGNSGISLDTNENLYEGSTYRLSFKYRVVMGNPTDLFVSFGEWIYSEDTSEYWVSIVTSESITPHISEEEWAEISVDLTMPSDFSNPTISIYFEEESYTANPNLKFDIDDIYLNEVLIEGGMDIPQAIVEWNPSPNLIGEIPELGVTTTGYYFYKIEDLDGNYSHNLLPIPASNGINSIVIDFDEVNIPQNVLLKLTIGCYSEQTYWQIPVFTSDNTINGLPIAEDYTFFSWGEVDEIIEGDIVLGDVTMDGEINVVDILAMINHILGTVLLESEQIEAADIVQDGLVNVSDIVAVVGVILGDSNGGGEPDTGSDQ